MCYKSMQRHISHQLHSSFQREGSVHSVQTLLLFLPFPLSFFLCFSFEKKKCVSCLFVLVTLILTVFSITFSPAYFFFSRSSCQFSLPAFLLVLTFTLLLTQLAFLLLSTSVPPTLSFFLPSLRSLLYDVLPSLCGCLGGKVVTVLYSSCMAESQKRSYTCICSLCP